MHALERQSPGSALYLEVYALRVFLRYSRISEEQDRGSRCVMSMHVFTEKRPRPTLMWETSLSRYYAAGMLYNSSNSSLPVPAVDIEKQRCSSYSAYTFRVSQSEVADDLNARCTCRPQASGPCRTRMHERSRIHILSADQQTLDPIY